MKVDKQQFLRKFSCLFLTLTLACPLFGQVRPILQDRVVGNDAVAEVVTFRLTSKLMAREIPYRVIFPPKYKVDTLERYSVIYLLHGLTGHFDNWTNKSNLKVHAAAYKFIIVTPEGDNGWYTDSATTPNHKYESYIIQELIPEIDKKFRTIADRRGRAVAGLSMGGYGAVKFGIKYPEMFSLAGSFSGALGATSLNEKNAGNLIGRSIDAIFGPVESESRRLNDIFSIVRAATSRKIKSMPFLYIDCGTEDFLFQNNRDFVALLLEKNVPHEFRQLPGGHNWKYWDSQVKEFLELSERHFAA